METPAGHGGHRGTWGRVTWSHACHGLGGSPEPTQGPQAYFRNFGVEHHGKSPSSWKST